MNAEHDISPQAGSRRLLGRVRIEGFLTTRTGLHVGVPPDTLRVGGLDAPVVRSPFGREGKGAPYVPSSALKGKLRFLLEKLRRVSVRRVHAAGGDIRMHLCHDPHCDICRIFGSGPVAEETASIRPGLLHILDLWPEQYDEREPWAEEKDENAVDRTTQAANPRSIERVLPKRRFQLCCLYFVFDKQEMEYDLATLWKLFALLEDDALGGSGSRGYGAVRIILTKVEVREARGFTPWEEDRHHDWLLSGKESLLDWQKKLEEMVAVLPQEPGDLPRPLSMESTTTGNRWCTAVARLRFSTPLHIGTPGIGIEDTIPYLPSDTLFSGLCAAWGLIFGQESLMQDFLLPFLQDEQPPFLLSSAFPFHKDFYFLPKPLTSPTPERLPGEEEKEEEELRKKLKDISFVTADLFLPWLRKDLSVKEFDMLRTDALKGKLKKVLQEHPLPKIRIDRQEGRSNLYFRGQVLFADKSGLYCLVQYQDENARDNLKAAFTLLGELGVGGERSSSCGKFELNWLEKDELEPGSLRELLKEAGKAGDCYCLLSLYHPTADEIGDLLPHKEVSYTLVERGGWVDSPFHTSPLRRKACRMFKEGSLLEFDKKPQGMLVNVTPQGASHCVYRYGFAFVIPVPSELF